jgi:hypothetical protein
MSSSSFDVYKSEFLSTTEQIKSRIQSSKKINDVEDTTVDDLLKQGEDLVKQMGLEARGMDDAIVKRDLLAKVRFYDVCVFMNSVRNNITYSINVHINCK